MTREEAIEEFTYKFATSNGKESNGKESNGKDEDRIRWAAGKLLEMNGGRFGTAGEGELDVTLEGLASNDTFNRDLIRSILRYEDGSRRTNRVLPHMDEHVLKPIWEVDQVWKDPDQDATEKGIEDFTDEYLRKVQEVCQEHERDELPFEFGLCGKASQELHRRETEKRDEVLDEFAEELADQHLNLEEVDEPREEVIGQFRQAAEKLLEMDGEPYGLFQEPLDIDLKGFRDFDVHFQFLVEDIRAYERGNRSTKYVLPNMEKHVMYPFLEVNSVWKESGFDRTDHSREEQLKMMTTEYLKTCLQKVEKGGISPLPGFPAGSFELELRKRGEFPPVPNVTESTDKGPLYDSRFYEDLRLEHKRLAKSGQTEPVRIVGGAYAYEDMMEFIDFFSEQSYAASFPAYPVDATTETDLDVESGELFQLWAIPVAELPIKGASDSVLEPPSNCVEGWWEKYRGFGKKDPEQWAFDA